MAKFLFSTHFLILLQTLNASLFVNVNTARVVSLFSTGIASLPLHSLQLNVASLSFLFSRWRSSAFSSKTGYLAGRPLHRWAAGDSAGGGSTAGGGAMSTANSFRFFRPFPLRFSANSTGRCARPGDSQLEASDKFRESCFLLLDSSGLSGMFPIDMRRKTT